MWINSELSQFILVKLRFNKRLIVIPIILGVFDELIEAFSDLVLIFSSLFIMPKKGLSIWESLDTKESKKADNFQLALLFKIIQDLFYELRKHKKLRLVEVDTKDVQISVEFL